MCKELKTLKSCHILDRLREWFELYGNQNHQRAEEELRLAIDELYDYQQKDQKISNLEEKLSESKNDYSLLEEQLENANNWNKGLLEGNQKLKQQLAEKEKEFEMMMC